MQRLCAAGWVRTDQNGDGTRRRHTFLMTNVPAKTGTDAPAGRGERTSVSNLPDTGDQSTGQPCHPNILYNYSNNVPCHADPEPSRVAAGGDMQRKGHAAAAVGAEGSRERNLNRGKQDAEILNGIGLPPGQDYVSVGWVSVKATEAGPWDRWCRAQIGTPLERAASRIFYNGIEWYRVPLETPPTEPKLIAKAKSAFWQVRAHNRGGAP